MGLNEMGKAVAICWQNIPSHFPFTELGAWIVMPNHVHGIIIINNVNPNPRKGAINRAFTGNGNVGWISRFYDHIIFGEKESEEIYNYILNNPFKWEQDRNNPENLWM